MLPVRDKLRAVCHSLKMKSLEGLDANAQADLRSRISKLPSPEGILVMSGEDLQTLRSRLDRLLYDMDRADNTRTFGYALRHRVDKGLPPVLPPLLASRWYGRYKQGVANELDTSIRPD
jgi:hypothetical protein